MSDSKLSYEEKIKITRGKSNEKQTILPGQSGFSDDKTAFMLDEDTMVIYGEDEHDGPNYLTKEQAMLMFNLVERAI